MRYIRNAVISSRQWGNLGILRFWTDKEINLTDCVNKQGMATQTNTGGCTKHDNPQNGSVQSSTFTATMPSTDKWMKNLSGYPLTEAQVSLLVHRPNFAIALRFPFLGVYITTVDQAYLSLKPYEAEELRGEGREVLKHSYTPRNIITKEESTEGTKRRWK